MTAYLTRGRQADLANPARGQVCPSCGAPVQWLPHTAVGPRGEETADIIACSGCEWACLVLDGQAVAWPDAGALPKALTHAQSPLARPGGRRPWHTQQAWCGASVRNDEHTLDPTCPRCRARIAEYEACKF